MMFSTFQLPSPLGRLHIVCDKDALITVDFDGFSARLEQLLQQRFGAVTLPETSPAPHIGTAFDRYFAGELNSLDGLSVSMGGTEFQQRVWRQLRLIPAGSTLSYGGLARALGLRERESARAVGHANSLNPIAIVVPCHRVIGADGTLTGYAGGLWRKEWLLRHEGALLI